MGRQPGAVRGARAWCTVALMALLIASCAPDQGSRGPAPGAGQSVPSATAQSAAPPAPSPSSVAPPAPTATAAPAPATLKAIEYGLLADAFVYLGLERGYFAEQAIELDLIRAEPIQVTTLLATNQVDLAVISVSNQLFQALGRGVELRAVADAGRNVPRYSSTFLSVRKDLLDSGRVRDYPDLRGLTIALSGFGGGTTLYLGKGLERGGLTRDDANLVQVPYPDMAAAFSNRVLDAAMLTEPFGTLAQRQGLATKWKMAGELAGEVPGQLLHFSPSMGGDKRTAGERFMIGYVRAVRNYYDAFISGRGDRAPAVDVLIRRTNIKDPTLYDEMSMPTVDPNPYIDLPGIAAQQDWFYTQGLTPELRAPVDLTTFADRAFVDRALAVLGPYR